MLNWKHFEAKTSTTTCNDGTHHFTTEGYLVPLRGAVEEAARLAVDLYPLRPGCVRQEAAFTFEPYDERFTFRFRDQEVPPRQPSDFTPDPAGR